MHSEGLELAKPTYARLEDNLTRHRGDRSYSFRAMRAIPHMSRSKAILTALHRDTAVLGDPDCMVLYNLI